MIIQTSILIIKTINFASNRIRKLTKINHSKIDSIRSWCQRQTCSIFFHVNFFNFFIITIIKIKSHDCLFHRIMLNVTNFNNEFIMTTKSILTMKIFKTNMTNMRKTWKMNKTFLFDMRMITRNTIITINRKLIKKRVKKTKKIFSFFKFSFFVRLSSSANDVILRFNQIINCINTFVNVKLNELMKQRKHRRLSTSR